MLTLDDAIERAKTMAGDDNLLSQYSYDLLVSDLDDEDIYPFTMALTERGVLVKTSNSDAASFDEELVKNAQRYDTQSEGGIWTPSSWDDEDDEYWELDESDLEEYDDSEDYDGGLSTEEPGQADTVQSLQKSLEDAGIRLTPDGKVEMYGSAIPGIYKEKLPQGAMPIEIAIKFYDQMLDATESEQGRVDGLLDLLTRVTNQVSDLELSLEELENSGYSSESPNETVRDIAEGLQDVKDLIDNGDWTAAQRVGDEIRDMVDVYSGNRGDEYYNRLEVIDALDRLAEMKEFNPDVYQQVVDGLGGVAYDKAGRRLRHRRR